jgi:hypothetical protein
MKHVAAPSRQRNTHDTGFVAPGVTGESTGDVLTVAEARAAGLLGTQRQPRQEREYEMQCALIEWRDRLAGQYPILSRLVHWPSGEHRSKAAAARIRKMGGAPGLPDLWLFVPRLMSRGDGAVFVPGMCLELKAGPNTLAPAQRDWRLQLGLCGFAYEVVTDDWTQGARLIAAWCGLPNEVVP